MNGHRWLEWSVTRTEYDPGHRISVWVRLFGWGVVVSVVDRGVWVPPFSEREGRARVVYVWSLRLQGLRPLGG